MLLLLLHPAQAEDSAMNLTYDLPKSGAEKPQSILEPVTPRFARYPSQETARIVK